MKRQVGKLVFLWIMGRKRYHMECKRIQFSHNLPHFTLDLSLYYARINLEANRGNVIPKPLPNINSRWSSTIIANYDRWFYGYRYR